MNKKFRFIPVALAALMLGACSTNDDVVDGEAKERTTSYMAVQIVNAGNASGTRSYDPENSSAMSGDYEDGTGNESAISSARFYFFDENGGAYTVANGVNYLNKDVSVSNNSSDHDNATIEGATSAVLVIENSKRVPPASVVAIANCPENDTDLGSGSKTLTELKAICNGNFATTGENTFVMSNSVYDGGCEVKVAGHVKENESDAKDNPVVIYVERVVAKVNTALTNTESGKTDTYKVGQTAEKKDVYAKVMGWGVADENGKSYLLKKLESSYTDLGIDPWSSTEYRRSFWATSSTEKGKNNNSWTAMASKAIGTAQYTQESTPNQTSDFSDLKKNDLTKVVVAAQLVDNNGNAIELCQYKGVEYTSETAVKKVILNEIKGVYRIKTSDTETRELTEGDLTFTNKTGATNEAYKVYATVAEKDKSNSTISYQKCTDGTWSDCAYTDINTALSAADANAAQIRKNGKTYYYTTIEHIGDADKIGKYGVVRNHSYVVTIKSITGFGTPVYFPDKTIDPEPPTDSSTYLAAQIKVLSWRVVNSTVDLTTK